MITSAIEIRQWNKERIKSALQHLGTCKKADIARDTELSMATCSTALNEMLECGEILKVDQIAAGIGRPSDLFAYNRDFLHVLCICIFDEHGVPKVEFAVADALGNVIESGTAPVRSLTEESIQLLVAEKLHRDPTIRTVGIGVPGVVSDGVIESCDIAALTGADFPALLRAHFDVDVFVVNDINTITYYLYHNREQCRGNFASVYFPAAGAGYVGAGFIVDGHALSGTTMLSGELYHVAEAFGISREEQTAVLSDREAFCAYAAKILMVICCTVNPSDVVLMGNHITQEDAERIRAHCAALVSRRHLPEIRVENDIFEHYTNCLIRKTLNLALFPFMD